MRPVALPPGLEDQNVEIYLHNGELRALYNSKTLPFNQLPTEAIDAFSAAMIADKAALKSMIQDLHMTDPEAMLKKYIMCNFGNFDFQPDFNKDGIIVSECWDCGERGVCPGEGKICKLLQCKNGYLTRQQTEIFFMVIDGKLNKEIAEATGCTIPTVETHLKHIREKMGVNNRVEIMGWAIGRKLLLR